MKHIDLYTNPFYGGRFDKYALFSYKFMILAKMLRNSKIYTKNRFM